MANVTLYPTVTEILKASTITGDLLVLPPGQLDRKVYEKVAKAINAAGGKWKTNRKGFVFAAGDPAAKLGIALESGVVIDKKRELQAFFTPDPIAAEVVEVADVFGQHVLEPSAGDGAIVRACITAGAHSVTCIEIEPECEGPLKDALRHSPGNVTISDFLDVDPDTMPKFTRIVMNPPFKRKTYVKHIAHAKKFLAPGGHLFSIVPANDCDKLKELGAYTIMDFMAGAFKESGTYVATSLIQIDG